MTKREAEELIEIEIDGTENQECTEESIVEQTYTTAEFVSQAIDINEPIGNLKKLLEPRLQCSLDAHEICLQDIQLDPDRSLFDQGVKTDGTVQLSVQVISRQGIEPKLNILEIVKPVETVEVVIDPDAHHAEAEAHLVEEAQVITLDGTKHITTISDETSEQVTRWAAALEGYRKEQERLGIPYDPVQWSTDQVLHWVVWVMKEFSMTDIDLNALSIPGRELCSLSQEDFFQRVPRGEILWSHLELLRKYVLASQEHSGEIATVTIDQPVQIIPASVQPATPTTIKVINSSAKAAKVQRAPRISGEDRSSPGNRTVYYDIIQDFRGGALLDLLFVNREGLVGDVMVSGLLGHSDQEMLAFSILGEVRRATSRTSTLEFRRADFSLFRRLIDSVPWETFLKDKRVQE
ncbi:PREDICTED: GA-binding protein alpha chain-like, partial [Cariama cristata]|uniref:GA-binding protein alpha chain-like n=1 Tax=Cariama cristata TaxID=54380 RepID=UPI0005208C5A